MGRVGRVIGNTTIFFFGLTNVPGIQVAVDSLRVKELEDTSKCEHVQQFIETGSSR